MSRGARSPSSPPRLLRTQIRHSCDTGIQFVVLQLSCPFERVSRRLDHALANKTDRRSHRAVLSRVSRDSERNRSYSIGAPSRASALRSFNAFTVPLPAQRFQPASVMLCALDPSTFIVRGVKLVKALSVVIQAITTLRVKINTWTK
jgi:hypothetical protein